MPIKVRNVGHLGHHDWPLLAIAVILGRKRGPTDPVVHVVRMITGHVPRTIDDPLDVDAHLRLHRGHED